VTPRLDDAAVWAALEEVADPEIPVVSVVDLGIVQSVELQGGEVTVTITPTFSGCPALDVMRQEIVAVVSALGATAVHVPVSLSPAWTSDRIAPAARERMAAIGLAPPPPAGRFHSDAALALRPWAGPVADPVEAVACPFCGSSDTVLENAFGPTICRSLHYCRSCRQPFEQFKAL
jgi:ring-1,2-phenylacetyl-CoA epoxidase subunit PaaD